ncbi:hypothetical protein [Leifsonia sp. Leaf264]|uniref:hypothetical protein n=1 Tax=Leifsonia sp. Leaf264 TaxID=1736314 RepID=UPI0006FDF612|nr:hypothetical protein [Leifsonia sp. Leaf264]KQO98373.1 hypothetical protein ASF30_09950 [Leifsonia sp. Leaf264]
MTFTTAATIAADKLPEFYEPAEVSAAKNVIVDALEHINVADLDRIELADKVVGALLAAGIGIPEQIIDPYTGRPAQTLPAVIAVGAATVTGPTEFTGTTEQTVTIDDGFEFQDGYTVFKAVAVRVVDHYSPWHAGGVKRHNRLLAEHVADNRGNRVDVVGGYTRTLDPSEVRGRDFTEFVDKAAAVAPHLFARQAAASVA